MPRQVVLPRRRKAKRKPLKGEAVKSDHQESPKLVVSVSELLIAAAILSGWFALFFPAIESSKEESKSAAVTAAAPPFARRQALAVPHRNADRGHRGRRLVRRRRSFAPPEIDSRALPLEGGSRESSRVCPTRRRGEDFHTGGEGVGGPADRPSGAVC
jgi:hypothetical protein